jgi:hypothetical protein
MDIKAMTSLKQGAAFIAAALLSLTMAAFAVAPASAQEISPEHLALARKYVDITDKSAIYEVTLVETGIDTMKVLAGQNPEMGKKVEDAIGKVIETYKGKKGDLLDQFARVYAQRFSPEELQQIVDFYTSPTGTKLANANPDINKDLQTVMKVFDNNLKTEFFAKVRAELKAQGVDL